MEIEGACKMSLLSLLKNSPDQVLMPFRPISLKGHGPDVLLNERS